MVVQVERRRRGRWMRTAAAHVVLILDVVIETVVWISEDRPLAGYQLK